jgi:signal transduction histidine kinase
LENAVKFSPERSTIDCVVENRESDVQLSVRDQGPGIPLGEQELIFNRFYRSKETQKQTQGSGLGLALVRRIAQVHGAHVQIKSDGASGTWIAVDFPKPGLKI